MEALFVTAMAAQMLRSSYHIASSLYDAIPKARGQITIEITTSDGKTSSRETIETPTSTISFSLPKVSSLLDSLAYHLQTLYLFTYYDVKTAVLPWTLFGVAHAFSATNLKLVLTPSLLHIITRLPMVLGWIWLNLLAFTIGNQRRPDSILEDTLNKPYRPIAAKRITSSNARYLMFAAYLAALMFSLRYGGVGPCIFCIILGYLYNDLGGANKSWIIRNLLNGLGYTAFGAGAMEVALGRGVAYSPVLVQWLRIVVMVITSSLQAADLPDQVGDAMTNRRTLPLIIGDEACRWSVVIVCMAWSFYCPYFWSLSALGYVLPIIGSIVLTKRTLTKRSVIDDKKTYKIWNLWLMSIYTLPMAKALLG